MVTDILKHPVRKPVLEQEKGKPRLLKLETKEFGKSKSITLLPLRAILNSNNNWVSSHTKTTGTQTLVPMSMINISCITSFVIVVN